MNTTVTNETPIAMLTVGQLKAALNDNKPSPTPGSPQPSTTTYIYGLAGIKKLFDVSHSTAQRYKDTFLQPAVRQNGRKIIVDVEKALELFNKR